MHNILLWLFLYAVSNLLGQTIPFPWIHPIAMGLYTVSFLTWCFCTKYRDFIGLRLPRPRFWFYVLPLILLPVWNLTLNCPTLSAATVSGLFAAVAEELFFRGFALMYIPWKNRTWGAYAVSMVFALFHLLNWGTASPGDIAMQVLFAFAAGLAFGGITLQSRSLLPAITAHLLINLTATGTAATGFPIWVGIYLIYGIWLTQNYNKEL